MKMEKIRLSQLRKLISEDFGGSQVELSKASKVSASQINQYLTGYRNIGEMVARKLESSAGKPVGWLDKLSPIVEGTPTYGEGDVLPDDLILVPEYKINFSAGNGTLVYELEESDARVYRREWFLREHINPKHTKRFKVHGHSMETTLYDGDSVLVNLEENEVSQVVDGKIYAVRYGNELRVKRLFKKFDGSIVLHSDNPSYKEDEIPPETEPEMFSIIGRVRDKSGKGGL